MSDYSRPLGDTVKQARTRLKLTQYEVAELIDVDSRTILNIENYKGNPQNGSVVSIGSYLENRCTGNIYTRNPPGFTIFAAA